MKKFKLISTCASLALVVAFFVFGVYASRQVTLGVSGTISYSVQDVYIRLKYGLVGATSGNSGDLYSKPSDGQTPLEDSKEYGMPSGEFKDETGKDELVYFVEVENLHGQAIYIELDYTFSATSKYDGNPVVVTVNQYSVTNADITNDTTATKTFTSTVDGTSYTSTGDTACLPFKQNSVTTFRIVLKLQEDAKDFKLEKGNLNVNFKAALKEEDI